MLAPAPSPSQRPIVRENSAVTRMLSEPGPVTAPATVYGDCGGAPSGGCFAGIGCGDECGASGCCMPWYASFRALYMTRDQPNKVYTSAETAAVVNQGYYNDFNWTWGGEATVGYRFGCNCDWFVEGTYWGLKESSSGGDPGLMPPLDTPMIFGLTDMLNTTGGPGGGVQQASEWFDYSPCHYTWRTYEAQDLELNFGRTILGGQCCRWSVDAMVGVRWFRFRDGLIFGSMRDPNDGSPYAGDWIYLNDRITNDLVGAQAGFNVGYRFADCWKVFMTPKFGIYNNHTTLDYNVYAVGATSGIQYQASSQTYANPNYPVHATADGFAFLSQIDLGLDWQVTRHISTQVGYRVVAATGMGLADNQIPFYGNDTQAIGDIDRNGSLILHGAFGGLTFTW
jgi:hypothetical protein